MAQAKSVNAEKKLEATKLIKCASHGSLRDLKCLIKGTAELHTVDDDGTPLLHYAVFNPNTNVLEYLLEAGLSVEARDNKGATPLLSCANEGTLQNMWLLISHGADIHARDTQGSTVLHYAAVHTNPAEIISCLIGEGAKIDEKNTLGFTAFHTCAQEGNLRAMKSLVSEGVNFLQTTNSGRTALHCSVFDETCRALEYLITLGVAINTADGEGRTPLHLCAGGGTLRGTKLLVEAGADVKAVDEHGQTALHRAVTNQSTPAIIKYLSRQGIPSDSRDKTGKTPLHECAQSGNLKNMEVFLEVDSDLQRKDNHGQTVLHYAAVHRNSAAILAYLLNKGMPMDARDNLGNATIHSCASYGTKMNMQVLLRKGCDIETKNPAGQTPLFLAIINENAQAMIEYLLSEGAMINSHDKNGNSPLHLCVTQETLETVKFFVENGADIQAENANGVTALHMAIWNDKPAIVEYLLSKQTRKSKQRASIKGVFLHCIQKASLQNLKLLIDKGLDTRYTDQEGLTALHYAVKNEDRRVLELILNQGIPLEARSKNGATPLIHCAGRGTLQNLMLLIKKGADVQARDHDERTAFHFAVESAYAAEIFECLLEQGLSIEARDDHGMTPLHQCAHDGSLRNIKILFDKGASIKARGNKGFTALHYAAVNEKTSEIIDFLLSQGMLIETRNDIGFTALHQAITNGNVRNMKRLIEKGANVEARARNNITALHIAVLRGASSEVLQYLIEKGASINSRDINGRTPLLECATQGNLQKMKLLVEKGADIRDQDSKGLSALHLAASNKKTTEIMEYLLDTGISLEVKDRLGRTPLLYSAARGNLRNVKFLRERGADLKSLDKYKITALHHAASNIEGVPIIEYFLGEGIPVDVQDDIGLTPLSVSRGWRITENVTILMKNGAKN